MAKKVSNKTLKRRVRHSATMKALETMPTETNPVEAMQLVLDRAVAVFHYAAEEADKVEYTRRYRDTIAGRIPHEAIRFEADMRHEVAHLASRMIHLGIEGRKADAAEQLGSIIVGVIKGAMQQAGVKITPELRTAVRDELMALVKENAQEAKVA